MSYYFNAYDPDEDIGFYSRVGIRPNERVHGPGMSPWLPGQVVSATAGGRREQKTSDRSRTLLDVGDMKYELIEPMKRWRIAGFGQARVSDLKTARNAPGGFNGR